MSNKINQGKLACLLDYAKCVLSAVKNSFTKTSKLKASKLVLATLLLGVLGTNAFAQVGNVSLNSSTIKSTYQNGTDSANFIVGSEMGEIVVTLYDQDRNIVNDPYYDDKVYITIQSGVGYLSGRGEGSSTSVRAFSHGNGTYYAQIVTSTLGDINVTFSVDGVNSSKSIMLTFIVSSYFDANSDITADRLILAVSNTSLIEVTLKDDEGNLLVGSSNSVTITKIAGGDGTLGAVTQSGYYSYYAAPFTTNKVGNYTFSYSVNGGAQSTKNVTVVFTEIPNISSSTIKSMYGNGTETTNFRVGESGTIVVTLYDQNGNIVNDSYFDNKVYVAIQSGVGELNNMGLGSAFGAPAYSHGNGTYTIDIYSYTPGDSNITFSVNGVNSNKSIILTFEVGAYFDANSNITADPPSLVVNNSSLITVTLRDANGNLIDGKSVVITKTAGAASGTLSSVTAIGANSGNYTANFTTTKAGNYTFSYSVDGTASSKNATVVFTGISDINSSTIKSTAMNGAETANFTLTELGTIVVTLYDQNGNIVNDPYYNDKVHVAIQSGVGYLSGRGNTTSVEAMYNNKGAYTASIRSITSGEANVTFSVDGVNSNKSIIVTFTGDSPHPDLNSNITADSLSLAVIRTSLITVTLKDIYGGLIDGSNVTITKIAGPADGTLGATAPAGNGNYTATFNTNKAGSYTFSYSVNGENSTNSVTVVFTGTPDLSSSTIKSTIWDEVDDYIPCTDFSLGKSGHILVTLYDQNGNIVNDPYYYDKVRITIQSGVGEVGGLGGGKSIEASSYDNGTYEIPIFSMYYSGEANVTFFVDGVKSSKSIILTFRAYHYSDADSSITADPSILAVNSQSLITVTLKDAHGNLIDGSNVTIMKTAGAADGTLGAVTAVGSGNYTATFTTTKAGNYTFSYSASSADGYDQSTKNVTIEFTGNASANSSTIRSIDGNGTETANFAVNETGRIVVTLYDQNGNIVIDSNNIVEITIQSGVGQLAGMGTGSSVGASSDGNGTYRAYINSDTPGDANITFSVNGVNSSKSIIITYGTNSFSDADSNITADPLTLAVSNTSLITVTLKDANGNLIDGSSVTITNTAGPAGGVLDPVTPIGANSGNYTANFTTTKAGNYTFSYSVDGTSSTKNVTVEFIAGTPDINGTDANSSTSIVVNPSTSGVDTNESVTVTITDKYGNPISDLSDVKIYIISGTGALSGAVQEVLAINEGNGSYTTNLTSSVANIVTVGFKLGAAVSSLNANGTFTVGAYSDSNSNITADPLTLAVSNVSLITVTLKDANGNLIDGSSVTITNTAGPAGGVLDPVTPIGANSGNYTANFTTTKAGNYTFSYSVDGTSSTKNVTIEFIAGTPDINGTDANSSTSIVVNPSTSGVDTNESVTVTITDKYGNPISDLSDVKIYIISGTGALSGAVQEVLAINEGNGSYTTNLTSSVANIVTVGFKLGADSSSLNANGTFTVGAYSDSNSNITADPLTLAVSNTSLITVTLKDSNGNLIDGSSVTITNTAGPAGGVLDPVTPIGANSGNYTANFTTTKAGNYTFSYSVDGTSSTKNVTVEFIAGTPDINGTDANSSTSIVVNPSTSGVDTNESVTVTITDKYGNPINNLSDVKIYIISGTGALSGAVQEVLAINEGNGSYTTNLTSSVANIVTVGFKLGAAVSSLNANGTFTVGAYSDSNSNITADPLTLAVSNVSLITVTLKDSNGNLIDGKTVTIIKTAGPAGGVLDPVTPIGANSGNYTANFTTTKAGNYTFSYSVDGTSSTKNVTIEFIAGTPDINGTDANSSTSIVVNPSTSGVDTNESVTVTITDKYGNPISDLSDVKIYIISGTGALSGAVQEVTAVNAGNGSYTTNLTSSVANIVTVGFKLGAAVSSLNATGTFTVGAYSDSNSNITADPLLLAVSNRSLITVTLKDSNGNLIDGSSVTITNTAGPAGGVLDPVTPIGANSGNYTANFTTTKAGNYTFSYSVNGTSSTKNVTVEFIAGTPDINGTDANSSTSIVVNPSTSGVDTNESVTVTITDKYGNPINNLSDVKIYIISGTGALSGAVQEVTAVNVGDGTYTANLTSSIANIVTVGFKLGAAVSSLNATGTFTVGAYSDSNSNITADPLTLAVSNVSLITVTLKDANGNLIDGKTVTIIKTAGANDGTLGAITPIGANSGNYTANFTTTKAGNYTFSYSVDGGATSSKNVTVEFIAENASTNSSTIKSTAQNGTETANFALNEVGHIDVTLYDQNGNIVTSANMVEIIIQSGESAITGEVIKTVGRVVAWSHGNGTYYAWIASSIPGNANITFAVNGVNSNKSIIVAYGAVSYSDANSSITANPLSVTTDIGGSLITVTLKDANGNLIDGSNVTIIKTAGPAGGVLDPVTPIGANSGNYTANFTTTKAGNYTFSYSVDGGATSSNNVTVVFTAGASDANNSIIKSTDGNGTETANFAVNETGRIVVTLYDQNGNIVIDSNNIVEITIQSGVGQLAGMGTGSSVGASSDGNGTYRAYINSDTPGDANITFSVNGVNSSKSIIITYGTNSFSDADSNITADPLTLAVSNTSLITVTLKDANGNLIDGSSVTITNTAGPAGGVLDPVTPIGANSGNYTANFTTTKAGNYTFSYSVNGTSSTKNVTVEFIAGTPDINGTDANSSTSIVVNPSTSGVDTNESVTVTITDKYGNPISDLSDVKIYIISGTGALSGAVQEVLAINEGNGSYTTNLTSSVANIVTVGFKLGADSSSLNANGTFTVGAYSDSNSNITADPLTLAVSNTSLITVTLKDSNGNLIDGKTVSIIKTAGAASGTLGTITPIGSGNYTANFTTTKAGNYTFSYSVDGTSSTKNITVEFIAGNASANSSTIRSIDGNGTETANFEVNGGGIIVVTLYDQNGNIVIDSNNIVEITIQSGVGQLAGMGTGSSVGASSDGNGTYRAYINSDTPGDANITFAVNGALSNKSIIVTFGDTSSYSDANSNITADPLTLAVSNTSLITVTLKDANGNLIDGSSVTIMKTAGANDGTLGAITPIGANSGNYTANFTTTKAGNYTFSYSVDGTSSTKNVTVEFTAGNASANSSTIRSTDRNGNETANFAIGEFGEIVVTLYDQNGNIITDHTNVVKIIIQSGIGELSGFSGGGNISAVAYTRSDGSYVAYIRSYTPGDINITFDINGTQSSKSIMVTYGDTGSTLDSRSSITANPSSLTVSNTSLITVNLMDSNGNLIDGKSVNITKIAGSDDGTLSTVTTVGAGSGNYTANFTTTKAGEYTFSYSVDGFVSPKNVTVEFIAGAATANSSTIRSTTDVYNGTGTDSANFTLGEAGRIVIILYDQYGNIVKDYDAHEVDIIIQSGIGTLHGMGSSNTSIRANKNIYAVYDARIHSDTPGDINITFAVNGVKSNKSIVVNYEDLNVNSNITADPLLLAVSNTSLVTVTLKDANGNLIDGKIVTIAKIAGPFGALSAVTPIGNGSGNYTATFTTTKAGNYTFSYNDNNNGGASSTNNVTVEFIAGTPDINGTDANSSTSIVVNPSTSGVDTNESVTVTITDKYGNPINNLNDVKIYIISGTGALSGAVQEVTAVNAGNGSYTTTLTSSVANIVTVGFKLGAAVSSLNATGTFTVGAYSDSNSNITADPLLLAVSNTSLITVTLKDANGNLIDGSSVTITNTAGPAGGVLDPVTPIGANSGNYTANFTTTKAGNYTFSYSVNGTSSTKNVTVEFIAGTPDINGTDANSSTSIVVNPSTSGVDTNESVTVTITDKYGNPINNLSDVKIYIISGTGALSGAVQEVTAVNVGDGTYTANLTSSIANIVTVGFKLGAAVSSLNATGTFTVGAYSDSNSNITADPLTLAVSNVSLITVTLKDANGNLIDGKTVTIIKTAGANDGTLGAITPIGANSGNYTANFTTTKAGNYTFSYSVDGTSSTKNVTVEFIAGTPDINGTDANSSTSIVVNPSTSGVDTNESVTVTITDKYGNPINNLSDVKIYIISGTGALSGAVQEVSAVNAGNGSYTTTLTSSVANIVTVGFKLGAAVSSLNATGTFTVGSYSDSNSNITADPLLLAVSNTSLITVTLKDANGNLIDGSSVTITNTAGPAGGVLDPVTPIGANSGNYTANFTTTKAGNYTFSYSVNGTSSTKNVTVEFIAGTPDINGTDANSSTSITITPSSSEVYTNESVTVTVTDKHNNTINDLTNVKIYIVSGTGSLNGATLQEVAAVNVGDGTYTANLTSSIANIVTVGFKLGADSSSLNATGTFTVGAYSDSNSNITADPLLLAVSNTSLITVTLKDANGNLIDGSSVTIMKTAGAADGTLSAITPAGSGNYTANFTTTKAGNYTFSYSVDGTSSTKNVTVEFIAGNASANSSTIKSTARNGTETANFAIGETGRIIVTLYNENGNIVIDSNNIVDITIQSGVGRLTGSSGNDSSVEAVDQGNGNYIAFIDSTTLGEINVTFSVNGAPSSKSIIVTYKAGPYSDAKSEITANPLTLVVSNTSLITVTLKDIGGNLIDDKSVVITKIAGSDDGTLSTVTTVGAGSGNYTATFNTTKAGNYTFSYSVDGENQSTTTKNVTILFTAGTPDINGTDANSSTSIVVNPSTSGVDTNQSVTVTITDKYGNPINNLNDVKIYIISGTGALSGAVQEVTAVNAGNGSYTTNLTSSVANIVTVGFKLGADSSSLNATGTFTVGSYSDADSNITADPLLLAVSNTSLITVTLKDANGNLIDGKTVVITDPSGGTLGSVTPIGANSGNYTANFTTTKAGNYTFSYSVDGGATSSKNVTILFIAGNASANSSTIKSTDGRGIETANLTAGYGGHIVITLYDQNGNIIINHTNTVNITIQSGVGWLSGGGRSVVATNLGNGTYYADIDSNSLGDTNITFAVNGVNSSKSIVVTFGGSYLDANSNITADPLLLAVSNRSLITVTLRDDNGNLIAGKNVTIMKTAGANDGTLGAVTAVIGAGNYTANFTTTKAGNYTFSYSVDGGATSSKNVTVEFIAGTPDINGTDANSSTSIVVNPSTSGVDTNQSVTVTITDKYGNPINNLNDVKIYIISGTGALSGAVQEVSAVNAGNGSYTTTLTSSVANIVTVGFKLGAAVSSLNATGTFTVGAYSDSNSNITADPLTLAVSNTSLITVTLKDSNGNLIDGKTVTIMKTAGANDGTLGAITPIGANSGNYTANFTTTKAGNYTFTYSVDGTSSTKNVTVEFIAGNASANSSIIKSTAINGTETANFAIGESGYILVTLYDQNGNIITNANTVNIIIQSGVGTLSENMTSSNTSVVADYFGNGNYRVNIYSDTPGDINITFDVGGVISSKSIIVTYGDTGSDIYVELVSLSKKAKTGDIVRFQALVENRGNSTVSNFTLSNIIPAGFSYVDSSAYILDNSGADITKDLNVTWNSPLKINDINLAPHEKITAMYFLRVGGAVKAGKHVVTAASYNNPQLSKKLSNTASADVEISTNDPMLDESLIFGTVFHDRNGNGAQDKGEEGLPGVKIATAGGYIVTTDQYGRYHLLNILGGEWSRGRNFIMKVDKASLPRGTKFTTSNPQTRRITPGIPVRYDFGVQILGDANKTETLVEQGGQK